jgi:hypothetical protein
LEDDGSVTFLENQSTFVELKCTNIEETTGETKDESVDGWSRNRITSSSNDKNTVLIFQNGPVGIKSNGIQCYAISSVHCFQALSPVIEKIISFFKKVVDNDDTLFYRVKMIQRR